jgi:hypothetical protein
MDLQGVCLIVTKMSTYSSKEEEVPSWVLDPSAHAFLTRMLTMGKEAFLDHY